MKRLSLDFDNRCLCIMMPGQEGTQIVPELKKEDFESFIPGKYKDRSSFTWDFEAESISVNQPYKAINNFMITGTGVCLTQHYTESSDL